MFMAIITVITTQMIWTQSYSAALMRMKTTAVYAGKRLFRERQPTMDKSSRNEVRPHLDLTNEDAVRFTSYETAVCKNGTKLDLSTYPLIFWHLPKLVISWLLLGLGRGRCVVAQILTLIQTSLLIETDKPWGQYTIFFFSSCYRLATVLLYLNEPQEGGETAFPVAGNETFSVEVRISNCRCTSNNAGRVPSGHLSRHGFLGNNYDVLTRRQSEFNLTSQ